MRVCARERGARGRRARACAFARAPKPLEEEEEKEEEEREEEAGEEEEGEEKRRRRRTTTTTFTGYL